MIPVQIRDDLTAVLDAVLGHPHVHKAILETGPTGKETIIPAAKRLHDALISAWPRRDLPGAPVSEKQQEAALTKPVH